MTDAKDRPVFKIGAETGLSKRPDHPDFMVDSELKKIEFSGVRPNPNRQLWEFWILGKIEKEVPFLRVHLDPTALTRAHCELFGLIPDEAVFKEAIEKNKKLLEGPANAVKKEGKFFDDTKS